MATKKDWEDLNLSLGGGQKTFTALFDLNANDLLPYDPNKCWIAGQQRCRYMDKRPFWDFVDKGGMYWTSSVESGTNKSFVWHFFHVNRTDGGFIDISLYDNREYGLPVRCVKD